MIWLIEFLLTPVTRAPSIWEPPAPSDEGKGQNSKNSNHIHNRVWHMIRNYITIFMLKFPKSKIHTAYVPEPQIQRAEHSGSHQTQWSCLWSQRRDWSKTISSSNLYNTAHTWYTPHVTHSQHSTLKQNISITFFTWFFDERVPRNHSVICFLQNLSIEITRTQQLNRSTELSTDLIFPKFLDLIII